MAYNERDTIEERYCRTGVDQNLSKNAAPLSNVADRVQVFRLVDWRILILETVCSRTRKDYPRRISGISLKTSAGWQKRSSARGQCFACRSWRTKTRRYF